MNPIQTLDYFLSYAAYDSRRTFLTEEEHDTWVMHVLRENTVYLRITIYEIMEEDRAEAAEHLEEMIPELELLIARLPGNAEAYGEETLRYGQGDNRKVQDEIKFQMESLLEERKEELEEVR